MSKQSGYLAKQAQIQRAYIEAAEAVMKQLMCDTLQIAMSEEFGFGQERIERLVRKWGEIYSKYYPCLNATSSAESDVLRDKLDKQLIPLCSPNFQFCGFEERYPDLKKVKY